MASPTKPGFPHWNGLTALWSEPSLPVDLWESEDAFVLRALLPGRDAGTCGVSVLGEQLVIEGKQLPVSVPGGARVLVQELNPGSFRRTIDLPAPIDAERARADLRNGVLTVQLPKRRPEPPKRITVKKASRL